MGGGGGFQQNITEFAEFWSQFRVLGTTHELWVSIMVSPLYVSTVLFSLILARKGVTFTVFKLLINKPGLQLCQGPISPMCWPGVMPQYVVLSIFCDII